MDYDVVVIGAGLSGLVSATTAARARLRVLLLDAEAPQSLGGQAFWSFGGLFLVDSPEQRRLRVRDSEELAWSDWLGVAGFDRAEDHWPRQWARAYVHFASGEERAWLRQLGVSLFPAVQWAERGGNTVPRFHVTWGTGPGLLAPFVARAHEDPRIDIRHRHYVTRLETSDAGVTLSGTVLATDDAERGRPSNRTPAGEFTLTAQAVVVAAGGIGGNTELVRQNWPSGWGAPPDRLLHGVPDYVDGSMLAVAETAGGRWINSDRMWHYPEGIENHDPLWTGHGIRILPGPSSLWLDAAGHRLPAPCFPGFDALGALRQITATGHPWSWFVADLATVAKEFALSGSEQNSDLTGKDLRLLLHRLRPGPTPELQAFLGAGLDFVQADGVAELTHGMNRLMRDEPDAPLIAPEVLEGHIRERDRQVRSGLGKDPQVVATRAARTFGIDKLMRVISPHPLLGEDGRAGSHGPLVAARLHLLTRKSLGGLQTDLSARVLDSDGEPLPGVYAVGEAAGFGGGGMHGYRSLEGTFLGGCLFSGRTAGRALADDLGGGDGGR